MINEKILKKSDNMTKFNRKSKSEGNKHNLDLLKIYMFLKVAVFLINYFFEFMLFV